MKSVTQIIDAVFSSDKSVTYIDISTMSLPVRLIFFFYFFFFTPLVLLPLNEQCVSFFVNVEQWLIEARLLLTL